MFKAGITGGIGSGKTTVCKVFEILRIPVYYADTRAKQLMNSDPALKAALEHVFGKDIYDNGILDRHKLSGIIFNDKAALEKANHLVHPAVARDFVRWCEEQYAPYVLEESAILYENSMAQRFDRIILVTAPIGLRIKRVCERDGSTPGTVRTRMNSQWPDEKKSALADYVIYNDDTRLILPQVLDIHRRLSIDAAQPETCSGREKNAEKRF